MLCPAKATDSFGMAATILFKCHLLVDRENIQVAVNLRTGQTLQKLQSLIPETQCFKKSQFKG